MEDVNELDRTIVLPRDFKDPTIPGLKIVPIVGMAGIGKTTLAKQIFQLSKNRGIFERYAWVTVGQHSSKEQITRSIQEQEIDHSKRYLIVLDDVWDSRTWNNLSRLFFADHDVKALRVVVLTTRMQDVAHAVTRFANVVQMPFLNDEESWDLRDFKGLDFEFIPFGAGRRGCPGIEFAVASIELVLANLLLKFKWELPDEKDLIMSETPGIAVHRSVPLLAVAS